jgi:hypothetical protein
VPLSVISAARRRSPSGGTVLPGCWGWSSGRPAAARVWAACSCLGWSNMPPGRVTRGSGWRPAIRRWGFTGGVAADQLAIPERVTTPRGLRRWVPHATARAAVTGTTNTPIQSIAKTFEADKQPGNGPGQDPGTLPTGSPPQCTSGYHGRSQRRTRHQQGTPPVHSNQGCRSIRHGSRAGDARRLIHRHQDAAMTSPTPHRSASASDITSRRPNRLSRDSTALS